MLSFKSMHFSVTMVVQEAESVTDLSRLQRFINERNLPYVIGSPTAADGNCYLNALKQNFEFFEAQGIIDQSPRSINEMRRDVVKFMLDNEEFFIGKCENGVYKPGPLDRESFNRLIQDQSREGAYTDDAGWFILWSCKLYNVELEIVQTNIQTPVITSGIGGPIVTINKADGGDEKLVFHMGLIKISDSDNEVGHYQFIRKTSESVASWQSTSIVSPIKIQRSRLVRNYLKSPSPKKRRNEGHCSFCQVHIQSAQELEVHLSQSASCREGYLHSLKVKDLDAFLVSLSPCYFCKFSKDQIKLAVHLRKKTECFDKYCGKFGVQSISEIVKNIERLKRKIRESRSRASRRIETQIRKEKLEERAVQLTMTDLINQFKQKTSLTNVRHCINCHSNLTDSRAAELKRGQEDVPPVLFERVHCRRFQKYFACGRCKELSFKDKDCQIVPNIRLRRIQINNGGVIFVPPSSHEGDDTADAIEYGSQMEKVFFPCNVQALNMYPENQTIKKCSVSPSLIYKIGPVSEEVVSAMYENQLQKYHQAKKGDKFSGVIKDNARKLLSSAERVVLDHVIVGSDTWVKIEARNKIHKIEQFGSIFCNFSISVPVSTDIKASCAIQNGFVVTLDHKVGGNGEYEIVYRIHNHKADVDCCSEICQTEPLEDFLQHQTNKSFNDFDVIQNHLTTYVSNAVLKMNTLVRVFLKNTSSDLHSEDYTVDLEFQQDGFINIRGYIWPTSLEELNVNFSTYPSKPIVPELKKKLLNYVNSILTSSTDPVTLQSQFDLSKSDSIKVSDLANSHQFHHCKDSNCSRCASPALPSLQTIFIETPSPDCLLNVETAKSFNKMILSYLKLTSQADVYSTSSSDWLMKLFESVVLDTHKISEDILRIKTQIATFDFIIDERLIEMETNFNNPLMAAYHYSISCGEVSSSFGCVIQRQNLKDCYTKIYNISLLKAFNAPMVFDMMNGYNAEIEKPSNYMEVEDVELFSSHNLLNLSEAVTMFDREIPRSSSSTTIEYANTVKERKIYFKKVSHEESDITYKDEHGCLYERAQSNIDRYLDRRNGLIVTLMEFVQYYDYCGSEQSRQLMKIFNKNPEADIHSSEIKCAHNNEEFLPEFIVTHSNDVLKMRSKRKVVSYPRYEDDPDKLNFAKVLLFYPLTGETIDDADISALVQEVDLNGNNVIVRNER